jgi:hypothetical protein
VTTKGKNLITAANHGNYFGGDVGYTFDDETN